MKNSYWYETLEKIFASKVEQKKYVKMLRNARCVDYSVYSLVFALG